MKTDNGFGNAATYSRMRWTKRLKLEPNVIPILCRHEIDIGIHAPENKQLEKLFRKKTDSEKKFGIKSISHFGD